MTTSTLGQNKVALKRITVTQREGKSQTHQCATLAEAIHKMSTLCILGDHYKGEFTIEWEDGGKYTGSALFHEAVRKAGVRSVIAWAEGSVDTCAVREFRYPEHDYDLYVTEDLTSKLDAQEWVQIRFDAFEGAPFFTIASNGQPVTHADKVLLSDTGACYAINPRFEEAKPKGKAKASPAPQELALF